MKRLFHWTPAIVALTIASACTWLYLRPAEPITVKLVNASHRPVSAVLLKHPKGAELTKNIAVGETRVITFPTRGETAFSLKVRLADGGELLHAETYAESGYTFTETITDSGLKSELKLSRY